MGIGVELDEEDCSTGFVRKESSSGCLGGLGEVSLIRVFCVSFGFIGLEKASVGIFVSGIACCVSTGDFEAGINCIGIPSCWFSSVLTATVIDSSPLLDDESEWLSSSHKSC